jgi:flagellar basal-body rod modification protein FlgD
MLGKRFTNFYTCWTLQGVQLFGALAGTLLVLLPASAVVSCPTGQRNSTAYIRRSSLNRCEGIRAQPVSGSAFEVVSFTAGDMPSQNQLSVAIPSSREREPIVTIQSLSKNYLLNPLEFEFQNGRHRFTWSAVEVIQPAQVPVNSLRAVAYVNTQGSQIYYPVIFPRVSSSYRFVIYSQRRLKRVSLQILREGRVAHRIVRNTTQPRGELAFEWNGRTEDGQEAPAGRYQLRVEAVQEIPDSPPRSANIGLTFLHNPQWLR